MKPILTLLLSLLCLTASASPGQPYFVRQTISSSTPLPGLLTNANYWWSGQDASNTLSQWKDRILGNTFYALSGEEPSVTNYTNVTFTGTQAMTNVQIPFLYGAVAQTQVVAFVTKLATSAGSRQFLYRNQVAQGGTRFTCTAADKLYYYFDSANYYNLSAAIPENQIIDICYVMESGGSGLGTVAIYTNGVLGGSPSPSMTMPAADSYVLGNRPDRTLPIGCPIYELMIFTNCFWNQLGGASNFHWWRTNTPRLYDGGP